MIEMVRRSACAFVLAALIFLPGLPASAEAQDAFNDQKLEAFVVAVVKVDSLIDTWAPKIQSAENEEQAQAMNQQANDELRQAIEQTDGITIEEYKAISSAMREDSDLLTRVEAIYEKQTAK